MSYSFSALPTDLRAKSAAHLRAAHKAFAAVAEPEPTAFHDARWGEIPPEMLTQSHALPSAKQLGFMHLALARPYVSADGRPPPSLFKSADVLALARALKAYNPNEPRDSQGRWTGDGDGNGGLSEILDHLDPVSPAEAQEMPEEEGREDLSEPEQMRFDQFNAALDTLRALDPDNPQLTSLSGPDWVPTQANIDRINQEIADVSYQRTMDFLMPDNQPVGAQGNGQAVRILSGGLAAAQQDFDYLTVGGKIINNTYPGTWIELPGNTGFVGLRPQSTSGPPSLDVKIDDVPFKQIHDK